MEGRPEVAAERFEEMLQLEFMFPDERIEVRRWIGECVGAIYIRLQEASTVREKVILLGGFGKAMWQKGHDGRGRS